MSRLTQIFIRAQRIFALAGVFLLVSAGTISAQRVEAEAILSREQIRIGEQVELKLAVRYREGSKKAVVIWPKLEDTLVNKLEIVKIDTIVTSLANRASVLYEQARTITITAFDSGMYIIPRQNFRVDDDTVSTDEVRLYVASIPVDTTKPIKDIKGIYDVPPPPAIVDNTASNHLWIWIMAGVLTIGVAFLIIYFVRKKKAVPEIAPNTFARTILAHEKYLEQLAELGRKKPWLHGELKPYHIALTEILRSWIVDRYKIHAKEMTTVEIIRTLYSLRVNANAVMQLERALRMADMVKFAKWKASNEENETSLQLAINFVEATADVPPPQSMGGFQQ